MAVSDLSRQALLEAIAALHSQRAALGDALVDGALAPLLAQLGTRSAAPGLSPPPPIELERRLRQVSVLFLDIVGSTRLIQHLDPEDVQSVLDGALRAFTAIVAEHGGEVMSYAGDNVKAAFGADGTREDDAERAVRCGLALLEEAQRRGLDVKRVFGHDGFDARVGIHTGAVIRGGGIQRDKSLTGLAVTIAARMEQAAPAGGLRISQDTWALVRGLFDAEGGGPMAVKGHDAPILTWLVRGIKPRAFRLPARGIEGLETALVGRRAELAALDAAFDGLLADRAPRAVTLIADAGLGKSRLLHEFQHRLAAHATTSWLLQARSQPSSALQPYGLLRDLLARQLDIADSDTPAVARAKLVEGLAPWLGQPGDPAPEVLGQLIGLDFAETPAVRRLGSDAALLRDRGLAVLTVWLARLAAHGSPVVLLLDDLHWSDDASLDAVTNLLTAAASPMLVLLCGRPGLLERRPAWGDGLAAHRRIDLQPLDAGEQRTLVDGLLQRLDDVPPLLSELVLRRAEGNPFYAEELVKMLLDRAVITTRDGDWQFHADRLQPDRLPTTLTGVLQARIDALTPEARRALQMASVIGPVFWDDALAALDSHSPDSLPVLQRRAMVQLRPTSAFDSAEEAFHHHLLHQVSYDTVLKPDRRQAHARAAAWLTARVGERSDEYLAITAEHHARAGHHLLAADWFARAADKAALRNAFRTALDFIDRAASEAAFSAEPWPPEKVARACNRQKDCCDALGLRDRQRLALDQLLTLGEQQGNDGWIADALAGMTLWAFHAGRLDESADYARRGALVAASADRAAAAALCHGNLAFMQINRNELDAAERNLVEAIRWAARASERMLSPHDGGLPVQMLLIEGFLRGNQNDRRGARSAIRRALTASEACDSRRLECSCHLFVADHALEAADLDEAATHVETARRIAIEFGLAARLPHTYLIKTRLFLYRERWDEAVAEVATGLASATAAGDTVTALRLRSYRAEAQWRAGRSDAAGALWTELVDLHRQRGEVDSARLLVLRLADARSASKHPDDVAAAHAAVVAELAAAGAGAPLDGPLGIAARMAGWRVLQRAGDPAAGAQLALAEASLLQELSALDDVDERERVARVVPGHLEVLQALGRTPRSLATSG